MASKIKQIAELMPPLQGWTIETYAAHNEAMRGVENRFQDERDRRYTEGAELRAVALKIKETADLAALTLARESQTLDQARLDALRDKTLGDSGVYATNSSVTAAITELKASLQPLVDYVSLHKGAELTKANLYTFVGGIVAIMAIFWYATRPGG